MNGAAGTQIQYGDARRCGPLLVAGVQPRAGGCGIRDMASAGGRGRNLELVEHRILRRLSQARGELGRHPAVTKCGYSLTEDLALMLGLLFRALAPMRSRINMRAVAEGIEATGREEAAYWLGVVMHRKHPRRVLTSLRCLLTEPRR